MSSHRLPISVKGIVFEDADFLKNKRKNAKILKNFKGATGGLNNISKN